jgi:hypothetical protein
VVLFCCPTRLTHLVAVPALHLASDWSMPPVV